MKIDPRTWDKAIEDIRAKRAGVAETARRLGVSENSVRKQLARARAGRRPPAPPPSPSPAASPAATPNVAPAVAASAAPTPAAAPTATDGGLEGFKAATGAADPAAAQTPAQAADAAAIARRERNAQTAAFAVGILQLSTGLACRGYAWFSGISLDAEDMAKLVEITPTERKILEDAAVPAMPYLEKYLEGSEEGALGLFLGHWASMLGGRIQTLKTKAAHA